MCFSPQPRAIFEHRNVQNGSAPVVFSTFWLTNMLRATAACHFSPVCQNSYLRTRRFSEATFRTSATTNHWKNTAIRDFTNIFRACWTPCYWLCTPVDLLAPDSTHMLIFLLLTWLLLDSSLQLYILSEVRLLNFLRPYMDPLGTDICLGISTKKTSLVRRLNEVEFTHQKGQQIRRPYLFSHANRWVIG